MSTKARKPLKPQPPSEVKPVALTLKVDRKTYKRLAVLATSGETLRTHQEILLTALTDYLDKHKE